MKTFETKKLYYTIGEVSKITSLPSYLLRAWEDEFSLVAPARNAKGNRIYTNKDISTILSIKHLVYDQGYTVHKAQEIINNTPSSESTTQTETLLKAHQEPIKPTRTSSAINRQRKTLLAIKSELEVLIDIFK